jgi:glycosyltransferase involved in cell wall biosynthesis
LLVKPRLLFISPRFLFPFDQGGKIRTANILRQMKGGAFTVTLASPAPADAARYGAEIAGICDEFLSWPEPRMGLPGKVLALGGALPVPVATDRSAAGSAVIAAALAKRPEVVLVDFPHAAVLLPDGPIPGTAIMFTHNIEAEIFERHAEVARGPMRVVWRSQAAKMRQFEGETLRRFDATIAVSSRDAKGLAQQYGLAEVAPIDTGVDLEFFPFAAPAPAPPEGGRIVFSGAMDSRSNIDGIGWLAEAVWPLIAARRPRAEALIIGRNPAEALVARVQKLGLPFTFTGFVDDIRPPMQTGHVAVIPLRVGSGTRIKAFEAMALGKPVVSTTLGVEGLDLDPGTHYARADTAEDFAAGVLRLLEDPAGSAAMAGAARALLEARFSWAQVARQFEAICLAALARKTG